MSGLHSTMDRPDSVSRVIAPMIIIAKTMNAQPKSHVAMGLSDPFEGAGFCSGSSMILRYVFDVYCYLSKKHCVKQVQLVNRALGIHGQF